MEKFSVKKPFTILVAVIAAIAIGFVSLTSMTLDLLPDLSLPYLLVITPYPGASPEKVEAEVSEPLENAFGTLTNVKNVNSVSAENYSMIQLEYENNTDMDSAIVKLSGALDQARTAFPETVGNSSLMEISMNMVATMYLAVEREGYDIYELSDYAEDHLLPLIERQNGVASVTTIGLVEKTVQVDLDRNKIDDLNAKILAETDAQLKDAQEKLDEAKEKVEDAQSALETQEQSFGDTLAAGIFSGITPAAAQASAQMQSEIQRLLPILASLQTQLQELPEASETALTGATDDLQAAAENAQKEAAAAAAALAQAQKSLAEAEKAYEKANEAYTSAAASAAVADLAQAVADAAAASGDAADESVRSAVEAAVASAVAGGAEEAPFRAAIENVATLAAASGSASSEAVLAAIGQAQLAGVPAVVNAALADAAETLAEAQQAVATGRMTVEEAQGRVVVALTAVAKATGDTPAGQAISEIDAAALNRSLTEMSQALNDLQSTLNGGTMQSLIQAASKLSAITPRLQRIAETIQTADPGGTTAGNTNTVADGANTLSGLAASVPQLIAGLQSGVGALTQGELDAAIAFSTMTQQLLDAETQLGTAQAQFDTAKEEALKNANADMLLSAETLSGMIYAQNFAMPAGYIEDKNGESWLLKVGDAYEAPEEIENILLADIDHIGPVRLLDVATITVIDNANDHYAKLNGEDGVIFAVYKSSTAGTNAVSQNVRGALEDLKAQTEGLQVSVLMDQGDYINMIVEDILQSILIGSLLAIIVLAIFLRNVRPTILVAISIPISLLFALIAMYFSKLTLNIMTLSGLALGIGMLVDNSIVVIENIFRLRGNGVPAARAAVQGAKQVAGPITGSTLTTLCVFLPMLFTSGTVRELMLPMALSIAFCLFASLLIALTVVPAASSTLLKKMKPKKAGIFEKLLDGYGKALALVLRFKPAALLLATLLLLLSIFWVARMGIVVLPEMSGQNVQLNFQTPEEDTREESYARAGEVMEALLQVEGAKDVGVMDAGSSLGFVSSFRGNSDNYGSYLAYVDPAEGVDIKDLQAGVEEAVKDFDFEVTVETGGMSEMSGYLADGLSVNIYGNDLARMEEISEEVMQAAESIEGFADASNGLEEMEQTLHLVIDRDAAMKKGLTVAQIYTEISKRMTTEVSATSITVDGRQIDVMIRDVTDPLLRENLLDMEFENTQVAQETEMNMDALLSALPEEDADNENTADDASEDTSAETEAEEKEEDVIRLGDIAHIEETTAMTSISHSNLTRYLTVTARTEEGYNTELLSRQLRTKLNAIKTPNGISIALEGESTQINEMVTQMSKMIALALLLIYLVMVAQFQSLLSPFIILFTIPLAFTGGMIGLVVAREQLSMLALMGFLILMGTVVNNGIVFVDYVNRLRIGGLDRREALIAAGKTRMRPILMTTLTTVLAMSYLIAGSDLGSQMGRGMAIVIVGGLIYATFMTLFIVPVMYDILFKRKPLVVDVGDDLDDAPDDAAAYLAKYHAEDDA